MLVEETGGSAFMVLSLFGCFSVFEPAYHAAINGVLCSSYAIAPAVACFVIDSWPEGVPLLPGYLLLCGVNMQVWGTS